MSGREQRVAGVLRRVLDLEPDFPFERLVRGELPEWDSLRHVKVMIELQKELGVRFSATEIMEAGSAAAIVRLLGGKP